MSICDNGAAGRSLRCAPVERAASGWLRFGITALPPHGPPPSAR